MLCPLLEDIETIEIGIALFNDEDATSPAV
jgi:hypothetical protein